jgi:hypothetical protein
MVRNLDQVHCPYPKLRSFHAFFTPLLPELRFGVSQQQETGTAILEA